jgi:hypothetical protein
MRRYRASAFSDDVITSICEPFSTPRGGGRAQVGGGKKVLEPFLPTRASGGAETDLIQHQPRRRVKACGNFGVLVGRSCIRRTAVRGCHATNDAVLA